MGVGVGVAVETLDPIHRSHTGDEPLALEERQIPVDRSQRDIRLLLLALILQLIMELVQRGHIHILLQQVKLPHMQIALIIHTPLRQQELFKVLAKELLRTYNRI